VRRTEAILCKEPHHLLYNFVKVHSAHQTLADRLGLKVTMKTDHSTVVFLHEKKYTS
jgi:hypothetical protein